FYRQLGLWARAILPEQDIRNGIVTIQIIEGRLGKVIIKSEAQEPNLKLEIVRKFIENKISRQSILNINQLEKNIQNLNNIPGIQSVATLEAGQAVGETDVVIQLENRKRLSGTFQGDSFGSRSSGKSRATALVNVDSLLKEGEQFTIQRVQTIGSEYDAVAGSFRIGYDGTRGTLKAAKLRYDLGDPFASTNPTGNSQELSLSIDKPLNAIGKTNLSSNFTLSKSDYENNNNTGSHVEKKISRAIAKLNFNRADQFYKGGVNYGSLSLTIGDLDDTSTNSTTNNAIGQFSKLNANVSRFQRLTDQNALQVNLSGQYSFKNLDSAEKFSLGGPYGIRAYPNSEGQGDHGLMANVELKHGFSKTLEGMIFYDWGWVQQHQNTYSTWNQNNPTLKNIYQLQGAGVGINWNINPTTNANWVFSTTLGSNHGEDASGLDNDGLSKDKRSYLSVTSKF
ncbi:MAG: ShlB/FhaC/HecB family hemolysin secretion/activation protein, partial [Candidatus Nanopelagicales bacterium]